MMRTEDLSLEGKMPSFLGLQLKLTEIQNYLLKKKIPDEVTKNVPESCLQCASFVTQRHTYQDSPWKAVGTVKIQVYVCVCVCPQILKRVEWSL